MGVVYAGEIIEFGTTRQVFKDPKHPYTKGLFNAVPSMSLDVDRLSPVKGLPPNPTKLPPGCKFLRRCTFATEKCKKPVADVQFEDGHRCKCCMYDGAAEWINQIQC